MNSRKAKSKNNNAVFNKAGRPNLLGENLIKKDKYTAISTRAADGVINRKQILNISREVVRANKENALEESGRTLHLTDRWSRHVLTKMEWTEPN